jgi:Flp pilus assembly pilin Flp
VVVAAELARLFLTGWYGLVREDRGATAIEYSIVAAGVALAVTGVIHVLGANVLEALFIRKEKQALEGAKAMAEYQAARAAEAEKTKRLRAARLAREAEADAERGNGQPAKTVAWSV